jgi:hypothetical protein
VNRSALDHPANAGLRRHFQSRSQPPGLPPLASPDQVTNPYETLGAHPDLVTRLWDELGGKLPAGCRIVFQGIPVLMHPTTGIVFGFATGTHTYALRLPRREQGHAISAGATRIKDYPAIRLRFDLDDFGPEWVFCGWFPDEEAWCRSAFQHAGSGKGETS